LEIIKIKNQLKNNYMKIKKIVSAVVFAIACSSCSNSTTDSGKTGTADPANFQALDTTKLAKGAAFYQCEMDPEVTSDKPGTCPKCGMDLEKFEKE
jgi:protein-arginine kinase activator protein McsA